MKNLLLVLIVFISVNLYSQGDTIRETEFDAILNAAFPELKGYDTTLVYHENGKVSYISTTFDGKRHGLYQSWYANGQLMYEGSYVHNKQDGLHISYFENGNIQSKSWYELSKTTKSIFYDENRKKSYATKDKSNGLIVKSWYKSGQKLIVEKHKKGFPINCSSRLFGLDGIGITKTKEFQESQYCTCNGKPVVLKNGVFVDDSNNPVNVNYTYRRKVWYENGQLKSKYVYKKGKTTFQEWDENGILIELEE